MIYIQDKNLKVAGKYIPGQIQKVSVTETGILDEQESKRSGTKANNPKGYEAPEIRIEMLFEENGTYDRNNMLRYIQRLFKGTNQTKQKKYKIYEEQINARGITEVYFNGFETSENIEDGDSYYTGTLTFVGTVICGINVVKTKKQQARELIAKRKKIAAQKALAAKKKTTKKTSKTPAKDTRSVSSAKKKAQKVVKK